MPGEIVCQAEIKTELPGDDHKDSQNVQNIEIANHADTEDDSPYSSVPLPNFSDEEQKTADNLVDWMNE